MKSNMNAFIDNLCGNISKKNNHYIIAEMVQSISSRKTVK